ncbi:hypothetical protein BpHYR1_007442 [Brachionus plicatilis]|uniref:Uncharacterized protein n=1 Tax=Brachionus plicatilis TaxID=10195 RepID=A0A3M7PNR5_BRAPC|nr:hypothetical protein BpHYR1_007442 [Brachionus plicatilis]
MFSFMLIFTVKSKDFELLSNLCSLDVFESLKIINVLKNHLFFINSMKKWSDRFRLTGQNRSSWYFLKLKNHT